MKSASLLLWCPSLVLSTAKMGGNDASYSGGQYLKRCTVQYELNIAISGAESPYKLVKVTREKVSGPFKKDIPVDIIMKLNHEKEIARQIAAPTQQGQANEAPREGTWLKARKRPIKKRPK